MVNVKSGNFLIFENKESPHLTKLYYVAEELNSADRKNKQFVIVDTDTNEHRIVSFSWIKENTRKVI